MRRHRLLTSGLAAILVSVAALFGTVTPVAAEAGLACIDIIDGGASSTADSVSVDMVLARRSCSTMTYRVTLVMWDSSSRVVTKQGNGLPTLRFDFAGTAPEDVRCARGETLDQGNVHDTAPDSGCAVLSSIAGPPPVGDYDPRLAACVDLRYLSGRYAMAGSTPSLTVDAELWRESCPKASYKIVAWRPRANGNRSIFYRATIAGDGIHRNVAFGPKPVPGAAGGKVCYAITSVKGGVLRDKLTGCAMWLADPQNGGGRGFN